MIGTTATGGEGPEPQRLADTKSAAWLAFARTGDPYNAAAALARLA